MYCKYCGKRIDTGTMRCRACGRPVGPLEGGSGFWELMDKAPEAAASPETEQQLRELQEQVDTLRKEIAKRPSPLRGAGAVLAGLLALLAIGLGGYLYLRVEGLNRQVQEQLLELSQTSRQQQEELAGLSETLDGRLVILEETVLEGVEALHFEKQPSDETIILRQAEEKCVFMAKVAGGSGPYTERWEKQGEDGNFEPINPNGDGYRWERNQGTFKLWITDAAEQHLGVYRLVVTDLRGNEVYSVLLRLSEKGAAPPNLEASSESDGSEAEGNNG